MAVSFCVSTPERYAPHYSTKRNVSGKYEKNNPNCKNDYSDNIFHHPYSLGVYSPPKLRAAQYHTAPVEYHCASISLAESE